MLDRMLTALVKRFSCMTAPAARTISGADTAKSARWCSPIPYVQTNLVSQLNLCHQLANAFSMTVSLSSPSIRYFPNVEIPNSTIVILLALSLSFNLKNYSNTNLEYKQPIYH